MATYYSKVVFVSFLSLICLAGAEPQSPYATTTVRLGKYLSKSVGSPASSFGGDLVCFVALGHPQTRASITYILEELHYVIVQIGNYLDLPFFGKNLQNEFILF